MATCPPFAWTCRSRLGTKSWCPTSQKKLYWKARLLGGSPCRSLACFDRPCMYGCIAVGFVGF
eukprot:5548803-Amphidinium_carterae.1